MNVSNCLLYYNVIKVESWNSNNKKILKDEVCKTGNDLGEDNYTPAIQCHVSFITQNVTIALLCIIISILSSKIQKSAFTVWLFRAV